MDSKQKIIFVQIGSSSSKLYNMIVKREIEAEINESLKGYPVVVLTGARQTGKTTLVKYISDKPYYNFENPDVLDVALNDPRLLINKIKDKGAIIDEFQRAPDIASYLQGIVDEKQNPGMFILTGSNNFLLMEKVSQSLAGRAAILNLNPFSIKELNAFNKSNETNELMYKGFFPAIHARNLNPSKAYSNYYKTYIEKDVRQLVNIKDLRLFRLFVKLCAGRAGQLVNYEQIANEIGVSGKIIKSWMSVLEASYIVYFLPPYLSNINKRLIKSPKMYFYDVGLVSYLLDIENSKQLESHPLRGSIFENMVINEYLKYRHNHGLDMNAFFYRDNHKNEVDLIHKSGLDFIFIEIKSAQTYNNNFRKKLDWLENVIHPNTVKKMVVYDGNEEYEKEGFKLVNYRNMIDALG